MKLSICAVVVALGLAGASPQGISGEQQGATQAKIDSTAHVSAPCEQGEDNRSSDLCAQWKAADSAYEGATWTRRTGWIGMVGLAIGLLTTIAAVCAAIFAKLAADHTRTGARATVAQVQADVLAPGYSTNWTFEADESFAFEIRAKNSGATRAENVALALAGAIWSGDGRFQKALTAEPTTFPDQIGSGTSEGFGFRVSAPGILDDVRSLSPETKADLTAQWTIVYSYRTIFGDEFEATTVRQWRVKINGDGGLVRTDHIDELPIKTTVRKIDSNRPW